MNCYRIIIFLSLIIVSGCTSQKKLVYFQGSIPPLSLDSIYKIRIYPGDLLSINIFTINSEAFPYLSLPNEKSVADNRSAYEKGIIVNENGDVALPLAGNVNVTGLTISEARLKITNTFKEFITDPIVTVKKLNFKVTVLGEVNRPGSFNIQNEKATLPEVLGMAGDLSQFADRKNLRIIREENGKRNDFFVDLTNSNSLTPMSYYLHPDDIIYVQPVKRRAFQNISPSVTLFASILTSTVVIMTFILTNSK